MFSSNTSQVSNDAVFVEDVFSTWLYTGNGSTQTITNGIDLAGKGGLVWAKKRTSATDENHVLFDTARGQPWLSSNTTNAQLGTTGYINYNADGFGWTFGSASWNSSGVPYASWTFRKQPKFFDVVTWSGNNVNGRQIAHSLGSVPGCIIVKNVTNADNWAVYHRSNTAGGNDPQNYALYLNTTAGNFGAGFWNNTAPTSTVFTVANDSRVNTSGNTYVAYLFAHNAGGFGLTGTDNVISCGSYTGNAGVNNINLGWEPQWIMIKATGLTGPHWYMFDNMRGWNLSTDDFFLGANLSDAEANFRTAISGNDLGEPTATGFTLRTNSGAVNGSGQNYIYIAIRRGPMKTPTSGTSVFSPQFQGAGTTATSPTFNAGFVTDALLRATRGGGSSSYPAMGDRLRGASPFLTTSSTSAETASTTFKYDSMTGFYNPSGSATTDIIGWMFRRAPGFFDEVCWNGTNADQTLNHNLGVVPELLIFKPRTQAGYNWEVSTKYTGSDYLRLVLQLTNAGSTLAYSGGGPIPAAPTATQFSVGQFYNPTGGNVAYLFASCPGVSKVGTYTGNGSTQTINCGFTGGARFVMIKRIDSTSNWQVWDTARGMVSGTDPYLRLNDTVAETNIDLVYTTTGGFFLASSSASVNGGSGATYLYLAIA